MSAAKQLPLHAAHEALGGTFEEGLGYQLPQAYGDHEAEVRFVRESAGLFDQSYRGVLNLKGEGVAQVLHGVFSSHVEALAIGEGQPSSLLNAKGRLVGAFFLYRVAEHEFLLVTREPMRASLLNAVQRYAFLSDIDVVDVTGECSLLAVQGPQAPAVLSTAAGGSSPLAQAGQLAAVTLAEIPCHVACGGETPEGGFAVYVPTAQLETVWNAVLSALQAAGGGACGQRAAEILRLEAGHARYGQDYDDESFPNEIGWEAALTYDKCYVGQEIVARMRTYGEVNRKLRGLLLGSATEVARGCPVRVQSAESGDASVEAGTVTSCTWSSRLGESIALASIKRRHWGQEGLVVETTQGAVGARQVDLPFVRLDDPAGNE